MQNNVNAHRRAPLFLNKSFTKGIGNRGNSTPTQRSISVGKGGRNDRLNRSNSAQRSSAQSIRSARGRQGDNYSGGGNDYYANVDRLRSVNKLTTLESANIGNNKGRQNFKSLSPKVGLMPGPVQAFAMGGGVPQGPRA